LGFSSKKILTVGWNKGNVGATFPTFLTSDSTSGSLSHLFPVEFIKGDSYGALRYRCNCPNTQLAGVFLWSSSRLIWPFVTSIIFGNKSFLAENSDSVGVLSFYPISDKKLYRKQHIYS